MGQETRNRIHVRKLKGGPMRSVLNLKKACLVCGKVFRTYPSWPKKCCSCSCNGIYRSREAGTVMKACPYCKEYFRQTLYHSLKKYCSRKCRTAAIWENKKFYCLQCGAVAYMHWLNGKARFCSHRCCMRYYWKITKPKKEAHNGQEKTKEIGIAENGG